MYIGLDAKRIFLNNTGLGHYGRNLLYAMSGSFPDHSYFLFTPRTSSLFNVSASDRLKIVEPNRLPHKAFPSAWRSKFVAGDACRLKLDIYHGLSNEIPFGIHRFPVKTVVTVHDLIFERFPHQYNPIDVCIYRKKLLYACRFADRVIAVSRQTREDLIHYYHIAPDKIEVVYPSSDPAYRVPVDQLMKESVRAKYNLPRHFILYVGAVIERKNLMTLTEAMRQWDSCPPLVIIGTGHHYKKKVKDYLSGHKMSNRVIWLSERQPVLQADMPSLYQMSTLLVYPSVFEGFGIPIQEALWSGTPVITSEGSCFRETGGDAVQYVSPSDPTALAEAIHRVCTNQELASQMREKGLAYARRFGSETTAACMMKIYRNLYNDPQKMAG